MEPEKIPFATLLRIERGELPMTPAAELQLARLAELMKRALPDTGVSQVLTQTASVLAKVMEPIASSFATDALKFSSLAAKLPTLNHSALMAGFDKINFKSISANRLNVGPINALTLSSSVLNKTQFDGTLKALETLRPFVEQLKRIATKQSEIKAITLEVYKNEKELYYEEYGIRVPYELFWDWFLEKNGDLPLWRVFEDATYEAIAEGYGRYIAEKRHKRILNSNVHFEMLNDQKPVTNLLLSANNQIHTHNQLSTPDEM